ncbi:MAG: helix-turn-helix domain-containing protein [Mucilaginibacter sp.]
MEPFGYDKLPEVVRQLFEKVERIEQLLDNLCLNDNADDRLLTVEEAAEFLKTTPTALYSKVSRKEIPVYKPGKRLYFDKNELKDWLLAGKRRTVAEIVSVARRVPEINTKL